MPSLSKMTDIIQPQTCIQRNILCLPFKRRTTPERAQELNATFDTLILELARCQVWSPLMVKGLCGWNDLLLEEQDCTTCPSRTKDPVAWLNGLTLVSLWWVWIRWITWSFRLTGHRKQANQGFPLQAMGVSWCFDIFTGISKNTTIPTTHCKKNNFTKHFVLFYNINI